MTRQLLIYIAALIAADIGLLFALFHLHTPLPILVFVSLITPLLLTMPIIRIAPRHCVICGKRTRRYVPFLQRLKEFFKINSVGPRCSLHAR